MSLYALSWAFAESEAGGNDRLVVLTLAHHANDGGFTGPGKATMARETRLSEATVWRCLSALAELGEIEKVTDASAAPTWWLSLPKNRRPGLYRMARYLTSRFATPPGIAQHATPQSGSSGDSDDLGSRWGRAGVHATPSDQGLRDANLEPRTTTTRLRSENAPDPDCVQCRGTGRLYRGADAKRGAVDGPCVCCDPRPLPTIETTR